MNATTDDVTTKAREKGKKQAFADIHNAGLSIREYIATACLQGLLASPLLRTIDRKPEIVMECVSFADHLLAELAK